MAFQTPSPWMQAQGPACAEASPHFPDPASRPPTYAQLRTKLTTLCPIMLNITLSAPLFLSLFLSSFSICNMYPFTGYAEH